MNKASERNGKMRTVRIRETGDHLLFVETIEQDLIIVGSQVDETDVLGHLELLLGTSRTSRFFILGLAIFVGGGVDVDECLLF